MSGHPVRPRLGARETEFVRAAPDRVQAALCCAFALAVNGLDASPVVGRIAAQAVFPGDGRRPRLAGAEAILGWLSGRFDALRRLAPGRLDRAELVRARGRTAVLVHRRGSGMGNRGLGQPAACFELNADEQGRIRGIACLEEPAALRVPDRSGLFPGVSAERLRQERAFEPPRLPHDAGFLFKVYQLPEDAAGNRVVEDAVAACLGRLPGSACRIFPVRSSTGRQGLEDELARYRIASFPAVVVEHRGELVTRLVGAWGPRQFHRALSDCIAL